MVSCDLRELVVYPRSKTYSLLNVSKQRYEKNAVKKSAVKSYKQSATRNGFEWHLNFLFTSVLNKLDGILD